MRTIKAFNLSPLHVEEDFGFLKQFHDEAVTLRGGSGGDSESPDEIADEVNPVLDGQISAFETKLDAFDEALKSSSSLPSTALATDADVERDSAWRGANAYVKAMTEHPDVATPPPLWRSRGYLIPMATPPASPRLRKAECCTISSKTSRRWTPRKRGSWRSPHGSTT
mgnify:FL=1